jgi:hypothetical protein
VTLFYPPILYSQGWISMHWCSKMPAVHPYRGGATWHIPGPIRRDIHDPASELPRIPIPRTGMNKDKKEGRGDARVSALS